MNRRSLLMFGIITMGLLLFQTGWQIEKTIVGGLMPKLWPFSYNFLTESSTWFNALIQVIFSTQIGVGTLPVMTGKFLYKGDAVRTCAVFICFNFLVTMVSTAYYLTIFNPNYTEDTQFPDLTTLTSIYDRATVELPHTYLPSLIPSLAYTMIFVAGLISLSIAIYTSSRILKRHPNYIMCLVGMFISIASLISPHFIVPRVIESKLVGTIIIFALIVDVIAISWVYGSKNLSIDLEFSVGHPISKLWIFFWKISPLILAEILVWWTVWPSDNYYDKFNDYFPRWIPITICAIIVMIIAVYEVTRQVDYNTWNMICESTKPAKDWGPGDPIVRHAWKQWKAVCDDTGKRDFTLKRRGTKDWTSSIKKGQYSHATRNNSFISNNNNNISEKYPGKHAMSTGGSNSPNYSGSMFGDSAIEEDMNSDKYPSNNLEAYSTATHTPDSRSRKSLNKRSSDVSQRSNTYLYDSTRCLESESREQQQQQHQSTTPHTTDFYSQKIPIRICNGSKHDNYTSRIEIVPPNDNSISQFHPYNSTFVHRLPSSTDYSNNYDFYNPQSASNLVHNIHVGQYSEGSSSASTKTTNTATTNNNYEHNWRQFENSRKNNFLDEFSTEL
jgi:solute carrier family 6 (neurotransmitter transporter), invertebrate